MKKKALVILLLIVMLVGTLTTFSYGAEKKTGLYKEDGQWKYFENGTFKEATGLVQRSDNKTWHYVENGIYKKVTGLVQCIQPGTSKGKWYYVVRGDLDSTATGLVQCVQPGSSKGKWYYVKNGKLNNSATGLIQCVQPGSSNGKWYYVQDGKLKNNATGVVQCVQPGSGSKGKWYYVKNGKKNDSTGVAECIQPGSSKGKYYYIKKGKLDKTYNGNATGITDGSAFTVKNGKATRKTTSSAVQTEITGWVVVEGRAVVVEKGQATNKTASRVGQTGVTGWVKVNGKWLYYKDGYHDSGFIGLAPSTKNGSLYASTYDTKGTIDWNWTGVQYYEKTETSYCVKNGAVDYNHNGLFINPDGGNGNKEAAIYCKNGAVDPSFTGFVKDEATGKLYYLEKGYSTYGMSVLDSVKYPGSDYRIVPTYTGRSLPEYSYELCWLGAPHLYETNWIYIKTDNPYVPSISFYDEEGYQLKPTFVIADNPKTGELGTDYYIFDDVKGIHATSEDNTYVYQTCYKVEGGYLFSTECFTGLRTGETVEEEMIYPGDYYISIGDNGSVVFGPIRYAPDTERESKEEWMQNIVDTTYKKGMSKKEHMKAICDYMRDISVYRYDHHTLKLSATPNWLREEPQYDSYTSPHEIVRFGDLIDYPLESCYEWYDYGTPQWQSVHAHAYSKEDDAYFSFCPSTNKVGHVPCEPFDFENYEYYKVLKYQAD